MKVMLSIAIAGAIGALMRYGVVSLFGARLFPWGTLTVNVVGSFLMGVAYVVIVERSIVDPHFKHLLMTGALGAFTTFSAFSLEAWVLAEKGEWALVGGYIIASVLLSIAGLGLGIFLTRASFA